MGAVRAKVPCTQSRYHCRLTEIPSENRFRFNSPAPSRGSEKQAGRAAMTGCKANPGLIDHRPVRVADLNRALFERLEGDPGLRFDGGSLEHAFSQFARPGVEQHQPGQVRGGRVW
ncbi:MAG: hypothetical protein QOE03_2693 [Micromonosporaceae bacterium]|nr:hypothetical protein [Micromonosporaceae bacterium]